MEIERLEKVARAKVRVCSRHEELITGFDKPNQDAEITSLKEHVQQLAKDLETERHARKDDNDRFLRMVEEKASDLEEQVRLYPCLRTVT